MFAGVGGFTIGFEEAGMKTVAFAEIDPWAAAVLKKHWPEIPNLGDVTEAKYPEAEVICAGFPCQDISSAGRRAGITGPRSGLWGQVVRAVRVVRPIVVALENVAALLNRGMGTVLGDLAALRYDAEWDCVQATAAGLPHSRDRVFIAAYAQRDKQSRPKPRLGTLGRMGRLIQPAPGNGDWQAALSALRRMDDGIQRSVDRTDCLRNAIVPQITAALGKSLIASVSDATTTDKG
jgi:DNA (cytosine-5)-methyltransferase 1